MALYKTIFTPKELVQINFVVKRSQVSQSTHVFSYFRIKGKKLFTKTGPQGRGGGGAYPMEQVQPRLKFMMSKTTSGLMLTKAIFLKTISVRWK